MTFEQTAPPAPPPPGQQTGQTAAPGTPAEPGEIVIPGSNAGEPLRISADGSGLHIIQGTSSTTIPLGKVIPQGAVQLAWAFTAIVAIVFVWAPISRILFRRYERRPASLHDEQRIRQLEERIASMERNLDTVAIEMERVSEAQRFTSRLLNENGASVPASSASSAASAASEK